MLLKSVRGLAILAVLVANVAAADEWSRLAGRWSIETLTANGRTLLDSKKRSAELIIRRFGRQRVILRTAEKDDIYLAFELDQTTSPKSATATFEDSGMVMKVLAIYRLEGDRLTVCFNGGRADRIEERPESFDDSAGILLECKRIAAWPGAGVSDEWETAIVENSVGMKLVRIPPGEFYMGSIASAVEDETRHRVAIRRPYHISACEVTSEQYASVVDKQMAGIETLSNQAPLDYPVTKVSWNEAVEFCRLLSSLPEERKSGRVYRLPTEAEWERACRGGSITRFAHGNKLHHSQANTQRADGEESALGRVARYAPNPYGLYDMHGNVYEWCHDWYGPYYSGAPVLVDPQGPLKGIRRVVRGGSFLTAPSECRCARRSKRDPETRFPDVGFRVVCEFVKVAPDYAAIAKSAKGQIEQCQWEYQRTSPLAEYPSRYAAIRIGQIEQEGGPAPVEVIMRTEVPKEISETKEGYVDWVMRGTAEIGVMVMASGETVHSLLVLQLNDNHVREVIDGELGGWQKRSEFTDSMEVTLRGLHEPFELERQLPLILISAERLKVNSLAAAFGLESKKLKRFGWWMPDVEKIVFKRRASDDPVQWFPGELPPRRGE